ncbi:MAG: long-chain fatty acid--CoA ligase [Balneola sp.]|nr:long-chain fatty acid--CoA ligase [Balneola sp.]MBE78430.1 long-chain fatty acid--CoA ligase [Balneola sp.]HBX66558.1 long-chain fatty acid--CoA ligase [Balneolaceae bacterium]|tara:strand:- start:13997 stop:15784 length:1788 start_codon:yes stop_codon:yes gene_type:complete
MKYEPTTILSIVAEGAAKNQTGIYSAVKRNGEWIETSIEDFNQMVNDLAMGLYELGVRKGDKVSLHAENSTEWLVIDQAVLSLGAVVVPIYSTQPGEQIKYILENSGTKVHFVSNDEVFAETKPLIKEIKSVEAIISILGSGHKKLKTFESVLEMGHKRSEEEPNLFEKLRNEVEPDDLATLIYTSGTTGVPKGVMLTHNNIAGNALASHEIFPFDTQAHDDPKVISYLPLAHMFERTASYIYAYMGVPPYYIDEVEEIKDDFAAVKPIYMVTVPRLLEKIVTGIKVKGQEMSGLKKQLYYWSVNLAEEYDPENPPATWKYKIADKLVYSKIRELFGGNMIGFNVGGAALSPNIARFINGIGIYCGLGYGLTETSPVLTGPPKGELRIGSSGKPLVDVEIKIAEDGEILARGPNIMVGYYQMPEKTEEAIDEDGWFYTGDIGHLDEDGWLFVTDRKKSLFKLSTGKYVAPQPIENALVNSGFIEQAVVVGSEHKFCGALIVPNWENMKKRFKTTNHEFPEDNLTTNKYVLSRIQKEIDKVNKDLSKWEKVKKFKLLEDQFTIENGEITPTLKVKRSVINKKYKEDIDSIYAEEES